ncbi:RelA/SpoT domain-containing protein [Lysobacter sp. H21R4]|uniref:RelA/SpoT domain-containing protein n=1 Tax=Lysobacter sp. H21R4 TaxID=2781021 RepID=UPI001887EA23|nr:RelA/SpoT domain-containing protein [Lysobacter sp. H21R4]QOY63691.1 RelA/SpoT domain-containing protein [Lysobacter sp. H21R4]
MALTTWDVESLVALYGQKKRLFELFLGSVESEFSSDVALNTGVPTIVHSLKKRLKDEANLRKKIERKIDGGRLVNNDNLFSEITDLAGLRVLHLYQDQFEKIHEFIKRKVRRRVWKLVEKPVAYTWDPESKDYFKRFSIRTELKSSYYTSVHYLLSPANDEETDIVCEVQVRTLFEEAWGEIDHSINYPVKTTNFASLEQLRVLSKLVSTGSRLADSIFKVHERGQE